MGMGVGTQCRGSDIHPIKTSDRIRPTYLVLKELNRFKLHWIQFNPQGGLAGGCT